MKVKTDIPNEHIISQDEMKPGQVGWIEGTTYHGTLVLCIYPHDLVSLKDPSLTWTEGSGLKVNLAPRGTEITLTTES